LRNEITARLNAMSAKLVAVEEQHENLMLQATEAGAKLENLQRSRLTYPGATPGGDGVQVRRAPRAQRAWRVGRLEASGGSEACLAWTLSDLQMRAYCYPTVSPRNPGSARIVIRAYHDFRFRQHPTGPQG
jgi:hypothetical protein